MRFMMVVRGPENVGAPPKAMIDAVDELTVEATRTGKLVSFGGLYPTARGFRVRSANGKVTVTDGPFTEAKEVIGGFAIYELKDKDEALAEARRFMEAHRLHWPSWNGETEVRQMFDGEPDFGQPVT